MSQDSRFYEDVGKLIEEAEKNNKKYPHVIHYTFQKGLDLYEVLKGRKYSPEERDEQIKFAISFARDIVLNGEDTLKLEQIERQAKTDRKEPSSSIESLLNHKTTPVVSLLFFNSYAPSKLIALPYH